MKKNLEKVLRFLSQRILVKYKPKIVAVTGSVGKTSTKEAIFVALHRSFKVRQSQKNYNNEIGVPLTIIGTASKNASVVGWIGILTKAILLILKRDRTYPEILILEVATDKPGDMSYLRTIFTPDYAVITNISGVHLEAFGKVENIAKEKFALIEGLSGDTPIFVNSDNDYLAKKLTSKKHHFIPYGFTDDAIIHTSDDRLLTDKKNRFRVLGIESAVRVENDSGKLFLPGVISRSHIYAGLAAIGVARAFGKPFDAILEDLRRYHLPAGRMKLLVGIKQTLVIDDTYNSSPASIKAALESIVRLPMQKGAKRWAVLGAMLELGTNSKKMHQQVGKDLYNSEFDFLITVGALAKDIAKGAIQAGMNENYVFSFDDQKVAGVFLEDRIDVNDVIFIKGSQGARMEKVVKEVMSDPMRASELLVRQDPSWID